MRKRYLLFWWLGLLPVWAAAQQDPMFTNYQFNALVFNPAYAGSNEHLTVNLIHRQQWLGFDGAPVTQSLVAHSPLKSERVGGGISLVNDKIGPTRSFDMALYYAYRMQIGKNKRMKLSLGLNAGVANWHGDWLDVVVEQGTDPSFQRNASAWLPNFGAGAYLYGKRFYAGLGCPKLLEHDLNKQNADDIGGKTYRHWYATIGGVVPLDGDQAIFRPSLLLRNSGLFSAYQKDVGRQNIGSPTALHIDFSFFFRQMFWVGLGYRSALQVQQSSNDAINFWASWYLRNGLRLGAAYDLTLSRLQQAGGNSFEVMAGYEFDIKVKQVASPRYF